MNDFLKRRIPTFATSIVIGSLAVGISVALASLTLTGTSISGDADVSVDGSGALNIGTASSTGVVVGKAGVPITLQEPSAIKGALTLGAASTTAGQLFLDNASNSFTTLLRASSSQASNLTFTLPGTAGTSGQGLLTDGTGGLYFGTGSSTGVSQAALDLKAPLASPTFTGNVTVGTTVLDPVQPPNNVVPALLPKFRLALAQTIAGTADTKILCIGDSTTIGQFAPAMNYPGRFATALNVAIPTNLGLTVPQSSWWSYGGDWSIFAGGFASNSAITANNPISSIVFTPSGSTYDSFDVYYFKGPGLGTLTATATGGTPVVINEGTGGTGTFKTTVTAGSASITNVLTITGTGSVYLVGVEPYLSTSSHVRVANAGVSGTTTGQWNQGGNFKTNEAVAAYAPNLTVIMLGINDAKTAVSTATVTANLTTLVNNAKLTGDVVLMTVPPSSDPTAVTFEAQYLPAMKSLANSLGIPLIDIYSRFGNTWQAAWMTDLFHPNVVGYADIGRTVAATLSRIY